VQDNSIVVDVRMINSSGIGTYLKNLLPIIAKKFDLTLLGNKEELNEMGWVDLRNVISFDANIYSIREQLLFPFIVPQTSLLWIPHFNAPLFPVRAKNIITTIHDVNHLAYRQDGFKIKHRYAKKLIDNSVLKSQKIITVSQFSKKEILKFTKSEEKKINVIYNGMDADFYKDPSGDQDVNLPKLYFLFVGNVKPHKNLITLLKAYMILPDYLRKRYKIVVLGKRDGFITPDKEIRYFIEKNNLEHSIHFTGYLNDNMIASLYKKATIFIFPSNYEGFGLPLLESMACDTPVICSNIPCFIEIAGDAALYFDQNKPVSLSEKIIQFIENKDLRDEFIEKGKIRIKRYAWKKAADEHMAIFKEIIDREEYV